MLCSRCSLFLLLAIVSAGFVAFRSQRNLGHYQLDEGWTNHAAIAEPDGLSHRGDKLVATDINDQRILNELSRRFRATNRLRINLQGVAGAEDFEKRQEYLLRLLDYYWFSKQRLMGMTRSEVEGIFGPLGTDPTRADISGGRDTFCLWFNEGRLISAFYSMGY
jgi:hypothetical protein